MKLHITTLDAITQLKTQGMPNILKIETSCESNGSNTCIIDELRSFIQSYSLDGTSKCISIVQKINVAMGHDSKP